MADDELPVLVFARVEAADGVERRGVDDAGDAPRQVAGEAHRRVGAVARAHHVDLRRRIAALDVVQQRLDPLLAGRRVGGDRGEFLVDEERPGADEKVAAHAIDKLSVLYARVHHARAAGEEDDDVAWRVAFGIEDVGHDLAARVFRGGDELLRGKRGEGEQGDETGDEAAHGLLDY